MIYLFKNKLPNSSKNVHYIYSNPSSFFDYLGTDYISFTEDNYRINNNVLEVDISAIDSNTKYNEITYIAWYNNQNWRFYFVNSQYYQSGFAIYELSLDIWGTYISQANFSNIRVTRCNRKIESSLKSGLYDPIPATSYTQWESLAEDLTTDDVSIVFTVVFSTGNSSILFNNAGSYTGVFSIALNAFPEGYTLKDACEAVGGIYNVEIRKDEAVTPTYEANVTKVFIIPNEALTRIQPTGNDVVAFNSQSSKGGLHIFGEYKCLPNRFAKPFHVDIDPDFQYYVGTKAEGLKIDRTTSQAYIYYVFITKQDGMQILVTQGDKMIDITQAFSVGVTNNNGNLTDYERIAQALNIIGGVASGGFQIATGGVGYVTGALTIANALQGGIVSGNARYIDGGDGLNTFYNNNKLIINNPYIVTKNRSLSDENMHARLYGAIFNSKLNSINELFDFDLLGSGDSQETYVEIDLRVDGVPLEAQSFIETTFATGVYIEQI